MSFIFQRFLDDCMGVLIADGCGMGKSLQAIGALYLIYLKAKSNGNQDGRVAIVTRTSLVPDVNEALTEFCSSLKQAGLAEFECDVLTMTQICKTEMRYAAIAIDEFHEYAGIDTQGREHVMNLRGRTGFLMLMSGTFLEKYCDPLKFGVCLMANPSLYKDIANDIDTWYYTKR
jgi:hypothetical protein